MSQLVKWMDRTLYPDHEHGWDHKHFRSKLLALVRPSDTVLDFGAGRGTLIEMDLREHVKSVCTVNVDPAVLTNPQVLEAKLMTGGRIPYDDESFDLVFSSCVWEHLETPEESFREVFRVLRPGGLFVGKTPNRRHYVALMASVTPHRFHEYINAKRGRPRRDTFLTFYRVNTPGKVRKCAQRVGFLVREIEMTEGRPEYLRLHASLYALGWLYERLVNSTRRLAAFRVTMTAVLEKPGAGIQSGSSAADRASK